MGTLDGLTFEAPGPGPWDVETVHLSRPVTALAAGMFPQALSEGFGEGTERYGLLLDTLDFAIVQRIPYARMLPVGAKNGPGEKLPPKLLLQLILRLHPEMRRRRRTAEKAERDKLWLQDLRRWDDDVKLATIARSLALLRVDPETLSDDELMNHLKECAEWAFRMVKQHQQFTVAALLPDCAAAGECDPLDGAVGPAGVVPAGRRLAGLGGMGARSRRPRRRDRGRRGGADQARFRRRCKFGAGVAAVAGGGGR